MSIPKIRHVVFYAPPLFAPFYNELLNTIVSNDATCLVLYTKYEKLQLERVAGNMRAQKMLSSNKSTFLFC
jgi:U3 small nucleolar RNA-associated protein 25